MKTIAAWLTMLVLLMGCAPWPANEAEPPGTIGDPLGEVDLRHCQDDSVRSVFVFRAPSVVAHAHVIASALDHELVVVDGREGFENSLGDWQWFTGGDVYSTSCVELDSLRQVRRHFLNLFEIVVAGVEQGGLDPHNAYDALATPRAIFGTAAVQVLRVPLDSTGADLQEGIAYVPDTPLELDATAVLERGANLSIAWSGNELLTRTADAGVRLFYADPKPDPRSGEFWIAYQGANGWGLYQSSQILGVFTSLDADRMAFSAEGGPATTAVATQDIATFHFDSAGCDDQLDPGNACESCAATKCEAEAATCCAVTGCVAAARCVLESGCTDAACLEVCNAEIESMGGAGAALEILQPLGDCVTKSCATDCQPLD